MNKALNGNAKMEGFQSDWSCAYFVNAGSGGRSMLLELQLAADEPNPEDNFSYLTTLAGSADELVSHPKIGAGAVIIFAADSASGAAFSATKSVCNVVIQGRGTRPWMTSVADRNLVETAIVDILRRCVPVVDSISRGPTAPPSP